MAAPNQKSKLTNLKSLLILPALWWGVAWFAPTAIDRICYSPSAIEIHYRFKSKIHWPQRFKFSLLLLRVRHSEVCSPKLDSIPDTRSTLSAGLDGRSRALLGWRVFEFFIFFWWLFVPTAIDRDLLLTLCDWDSLSVQMQNTFTAEV